MIKIILALILFYSVLFNVILIKTHSWQIKINEELKTEKSQALLDIKEVKNNLSKHSDLTRAITLVGQIPYDADYNNCYDHSKTLMKALQDKDIASSILINKNRTHAWIAVWIEATTGKFIPTDNIYQILEIRDENHKVICDAYNIVSGKNIIK